MIKSLIRRLTPRFALDTFRRSKREAERRNNAEKPTEQVFTEIYARNSWGGEQGDFYSGGGTGDERIAMAYINCLEGLEGTLKLSELRAVDLGCGDMRIGVEISDFFSSYTGVDIVRDLIDRHSKVLGTQKRQFQHLDIINDELPDGDFCMIRQVLQHLSNTQIVKILQKVRKYRYVLITEHLPSPNPGLRKNLDKPHGGDIRIYDNSGVYLDAPPFGLAEEEIEVVLEVEGHGYNNYVEPWMMGVIQTVLYRPGAQGSASNP